MNCAKPKVGEIIELRFHFLKQYCAVKKCTLLYPFSEIKTWQYLKESLERMAEKVLEIYWSAGIDLEGLIIILL